MCILLTKKQKIQSYSVSNGVKAPFTCEILEGMFNNICADEGLSDWLVTRLPAEGHHAESASACLSLPGGERQAWINRRQRRAMMDAKEIKKLLATVGLAGLLAGAGLTLPGCTSG